MSARRLLGLAPVIGLAFLAAGCGAPAPSRAAGPLAPVVPGQATTGPDLTGVNLPNFIVPISNGRVSRPKHALTPGVTTTSNATAICTNSPNLSGPTSIPYPVQTAVFAEYGYTTPALQHKYVLDYLVPISLGGAPVQANIWPAATRGTGFYQKQQLDHILYDMVCRRTITLATAQHSLETDWYAAWLKYVVATGHF